MVTIDGIYQDNSKINEDLNYNVDYLTCFNEYEKQGGKQQRTTGG